MKLSTQNNVPTIDSIHDGNRLQFFPFLIRRINKDDYNVIRIGSRKITLIATHEIGRQALRLLRQGLSLGQTRSILGAQCRRPSEQIDLKPLINALAGAKMIRRIDSKTVESEKPSPLRITYHYLQCGVLSLREAAAKAIIKYLPVEMSHRILFHFQLSRQRKKSEPLQARVRENLRLAFGPAAKSDWIHRVATQFEHELISRMIDSRCLSDMPNEKIVNWLRNTVQIFGSQHFDAANSQNQGVILCGFHFSTQVLLPLLLWLQNYSLTVVGLIGRTSDAEKFQTYYESVKRETPHCPDIKWFTTLDLRSFAELRKSLAQGQTVLLFADAFVPGFQTSQKSQARYFGNTIAEYLPSRTQTNLLGQTVTANKGAAWLHLQTGAPVVPIQLLRKRHVHYEVIFNPQLDFEGSRSIDRVTTVIYQALEKDLHHCPHQWVYWNVFHQMRIPVDGMDPLTRVHKFRQSDWPNREEAVAQVVPALHTTQRKEVKSDGR